VLAVAGAAVAWIALSAPALAHPERDVEPVL
jgi:hypothetical protein